MDKLECIKKKLINTLYDQVEKGFDEIDSEEFGDAIDVVKDIEKTMYYCAVIEEMSHVGEDEIRYDRNKYKSMIEGHKIEEYVKEMTQDVGHLMSLISPEEKMMLHDHMMALVNKIR